MNRNKISFFLLLLWASLATALAQPNPYMVADINTGVDYSPGSVPEHITVIGNKMYFTINSGESLWASDGTAAGTKRLTNSNMSEISNITNVDGFLYFSATTAANGTELYSYSFSGDSFHLRDINPGSGSSNPENMIGGFGGLLYFSADNGTNGTELYKADYNGIHLIDINPGALSSYPKNFTRVGGTLYFTATYTVLSTNSTNLYKYDGINCTRVLVSPLVNGSNPSNLINFNDTLYFAADAFLNERELFKYDGTNYTMININPSGSSSPEYLTVVNNLLYFSANYTLYKYDGTNYTIISGCHVPYNLTNVNGTLYFGAENGIDGWELFKYTGGTTATLIDIWPGTFDPCGGQGGCTLVPYSSNPEYLTNVNGTLYFVATNGTNGRELYKYDGTNYTLMDINIGTSSSNPASLTDFYGTLYFAASNGTNGIELWKSNGTQAGTQMVKDLNTIIAPSVFTGASPNFLEINGTLYFSTTTPANGQELYKYDGTTLSLIDINVGVGSSNPSNLTNVNGTLYFTADNGTNSTELYKYDGTNYTLIDIQAGAGGSYPIGLTNVNGTLYCSANNGNGANGRELWKINDTNYTLIEVNVGTGSSDPENLINVNGILYFTADNGTNGRELYKYNGTNYTLIDVNSTGSSFPSGLTNINGTLYFRADNGTNGSEFYKYNGTTLTTIDIEAGGESSYPDHFTDVNGVLYFSAYTSANGQEVYKYTGGTTVTLIDAFPGSDTFDPCGDAGDPPCPYTVARSTNPQSLTNVNGTLCFSGNNGTGGQVLYKYNGTTLTTIAVPGYDFVLGLMNINSNVYFLVAPASFASIDLYNYNGSSYTRISPSGSLVSGDLTNVNGTLYFTVNDAINGKELWKSDGTQVGTKMVKDIWSGAGNSSNPSNLFAAGSKLYFTATYNPTEDKYGRELWTLGNCAPTNTAVTAAGQSEAYNSETQVSPATQSCHCDVFNKLVATIDATGANPVSGAINSKEWIDATATANYVKRHYEINPATNPTTATGKVTLYFTQAEFDAYNVLVSSDLPTNSSDATGKANLRIKKYNGTSSDGTGAENTYAGAATTIDPVDTDIVWNASLSRWEVSFNVVGFGGFFVYAQQPQTSLTVSLVTPPAFYCAGSTVNASYTSSLLTFNSGNTFTLQLSDASGSFATPTVLKTVTATATSGTISGMIPWAQVAGMGYRVRVISSNTAFTGANNGANIEVKVSTATANISAVTGGLVANPTATGGVNKYIVGCQGANVVLTANASNQSSYEWRRNNVFITGSTNAPTLTVNSNWGDYQLVAIDGNGCGAAADTVGINLKPIPVANAGADRSICPNATTITKIGMTAATNTATLTTTYAWTNPNAANLAYLSSATAANPTILTSLPATTTYALRVNATYTEGSATYTCPSGYDSVLVTVLPQPIAPTISIVAGGADVCEGTTVKLYSTKAGATSVKWYRDGVYWSNVDTLTLLGTNGISRAFTTQAVSSSACGSPFSTPQNIIIRNAPIPTISTSPGVVSGSIIKVCPSISSAILTANITAGTPTYQWFKNNVAVTAGTGSTLAIGGISTTNTSYRVRATYTYGSLVCTTNSITMATRQDATAGGCRIRNTEVELENAISVYPNPTTDVLTIQIQSAEAQEGTLSLVNSLGQTVWSEKQNFHQGITDVQLPLTQLSVGIYHLIVDKSDWHQTLKVVKE